jgi:hypothetical protein
MYQDPVFASVNEHGGVDYTPHNKGVTPVFFVKEVIDPAASEKAGRAIYQDMEFVRIHVAGDALSVSVQFPDAEWMPGITYKQRFEESYTKWKSKGRALINGTPLSRWPLATPSFIKEMEFLNILSVDDLASVADVHLDRIADGRQWRDRAAAWLKSAKDGAVAARYAAENHRLREDVKELSERLAALEGDAKAPKAKRTVSAERRAQLTAQLARGRAAKKNPALDRPQHPHPSTG